MFKKILFAAAATMIVGGAAVIAHDDASAQRYGSGFARAGSHGGFSRVGGMSRPGGFVRRGGYSRFGGGVRSPRLTVRPAHLRFGSRPSHWRLGSRPSHWRLGSRPSHWRFGSRPTHWRFGSRPSHWRFASRPSHWRFGSYRHYRQWSWGGRVAVAPAPVYTTPVRTGAVCYDCGGWTKNGCYMTYRKFVDENGNAELRCVEACDEQPAAAPPPEQRS